MCKRKKIKQVSSSGIYEGEDIKLTMKEQLNILKKELNDDVKYNEGFFEYKDKKMLIKNITFLGWKDGEDRSFKKRIQLGASKALKEYVKNKVNKILVGIYKNMYDEVLYVVWDRFKDEIGKSSSNHVNVYDLFKAKSQGEIFVKYDRLGNRITVIPEGKLSVFLEKDVDPIEKIAEYIFDNNDVWYAENCIKEMYENSFKHAKQTEWPGFYFEFITEKIMKGTQGFKIPSGIKIGNWVPDALMEYPVDLKFHSIGSDLIAVIDYEGVIKAIGEYGKIGILLAEGISEKSAKSDTWRREYFGIKKLATENTRIIKGKVVIKNISYFDVK